MKIQNSRDFSYAKLKPRNPQTTTTTWRVVTSLLLFGIIKHLLAGYSGNTRLIIPSTPFISLGFSLRNSVGLGELSTCYYPHTSQ